MSFKDKIHYFLNQDIYIPNKKEFFTIAVLFGITAYLELVLLKPWNLDLFNSDRVISIWAGYGIIESLIFLIAFALPIVIFPKNETVYK